MIIVSMPYLRQSRPLVRLDLQVEDHNVGAGPAQRERIGAAKTTRAAGDESYAPA